MYDKAVPAEDTVFARHESNVRSYCRSFPAAFDTARGTELFTRDGRRFLDFLAGAGALNYGHNNPALVEPVIAYLTAGGVMHSLDMHTVAKERFIETFQDAILTPRGLRYKLQFTGPTGTNAVEAALKLARKITGRQNVVAFSNGFHGMTQGALAATANQSKRDGAGMMLSGVTHLPYDGFLGSDIDTMDVIEGLLAHTGSGIAPPAAFLVETVQGEGGLNAARTEWLQRLQALAEKIGALLILDDIQAGIGRADGFFSFETAGLDPDMVLLSKSLSGIGAPFALVLIRPEHDIWAPGEHNGTFRGNNLAFVAATAAIDSFWRDGAFQDHVAARAEQTAAGLDRLAACRPGVRRKGRGMFLGLEFDAPDLPGALSKGLFERGIVAETCGHRDQVLKFLPPLTVSADEIDEMLGVLADVLMRAAH